MSFSQPVFEFLAPSFGGYRPRRGRLGAESAMDNGYHSGAERNESAALIAIVNG
jgi:hypothetical protein